ncbi:MAG: hypothetical protein ABIR94_02530 [Rubrivivax sp.]
MLCCVRSVALGFLLLAAVAAPAVAEPNRSFTNKALRGEINMLRPPEVLLNGDPARLAPGARIRGEDNLLKMPSTLAGQRLVVQYTLDTEGQVLDVWVLTARERTKKPWPTTLEQARTWAFDVNGQVWTRR